MIEGIGGTQRKRRRDEGNNVGAEKQLPANQDLLRKIPRKDIHPPHPTESHVPTIETVQSASPPQEIVARAPVSEPKQEGISTGAKVAIGAGAAIAAVPLAAAVGATYAGHKAADYISNPIAKFVLNMVNKLGKFNPFSKVWNFLIGNKGGGSHGGHSHGHGHSHAHAAPSHAPNDHHSH